MHDSLGRLIVVKLPGLLPYSIMTTGELLNHLYIPLRISLPFTLLSGYAKLRTPFLSYARHTLRPLRLSHGGIGVDGKRSSVLLAFDLDPGPEVEPALPSPWRRRRKRK